MIYIPHFCEEKFWGGKQVYIWTIVFYVELTTLKNKKKLSLKNMNNALKHKFTFWKYYKDI